MDTLTDTLGEAATLVAAVVIDQQAPDSELLALATAIERVGRITDALRISIAGELYRRSDRSLGHDGLAARLGHRTPSALICSITGVAGRQADKRARIGVALADHPQFSRLGASFRAGDIDTDSADAIVSTLRPVMDSARPDSIERELASLVELAGLAPADDVLREARSARDRVNGEGIRSREDDVRARRFLRFGREIDGLIPFRGALPPEEAAVVFSLFDSRTSVRRSVGFGDASTPGPSSAETNAPSGVGFDGRTMDQRRIDTFVDICRIAGSLASTSNEPLLARGAGTIVVTLSMADLDAGSELTEGSRTARVDGQSSPISAADARRIACNAGILPLVLGGASQPLDLGYSRRLFSSGQRRALCQRDRGCAVDGCDAPPGWTEAHHVVPWSRGGPTDLKNGMLLCSFHHHQVHDGRLTVTTIDGESRICLTAEMPDVVTERAMS